MQPSNVTLLPAQRAVFLNVYANERTAPVWEQALFVAYFFALYLPLPELTPLRYLCILSLLGLFVWHRNETIPLLLKCWPLLGYPVLGLFSVFWTEYPADALRSATLLLLTPIQLVTMAVRIRPSVFLRLMMIAGALSCLYCIPYFATLNQGGPLEQKNLLAYQFMIVTLIALATALNPKEKLFFKAMAFATTPLAFIIQLNADSATSLVLALGGAFVLVAVKLFWSTAQNVQHLRTILLMLILASVLFAAIALLSMPQNSFLRDFLDLVGKDTTLTGRTGIWVVAEHVSRQHPWFGVGFEGFWQYNTGLAQTLNELNHTDPGSKISFHSAFWEVRVHLGFVGLGLFILSMVWAGLRTLGLWLKDGSVVNSSFLLFYVIIVVSCFTESYAAGTFSTITAIFYVGALAAFDVGGRKLVGRARLVEQRA